MFKEKIAPLNKETDALASIPYEKRTYTVDEVQRNGANHTIEAA